MSVSLASPIQPHELDKRMRRGLEDLADRVAERAIYDNGGRDLLLRVYLAGLYHGSEIQARRLTNSTDTGAA